MKTLIDRILFFSLIISQPVDIDLHMNRPSIMIAWIPVNQKVERQQSQPERQVKEVLTTPRSSIMSLLSYNAFTSEDSPSFHPGFL